MDDRYLADKFINISTFYRFILYIVILHRACPFTIIQTAFLKGLYQNTWSNSLAIGNLTRRSIPERWVHNCTSCTWNENSRNLQVRIYQCTHMQTRTHSNDDCNLPYRRSYRAGGKTKKTSGPLPRSHCKIVDLKVSVCKWKFNLIF